MKKGHTKVVFKPYIQNQGWLLPPSLGELIPENHIVRLVNEAIEGMDMSLILNAYEGGGASNYHPKMLLKALVYGYIEKLYSSRRIEKAIKENICFMWLCGMQQPDHNTINRFRKGQLKNTVKDVFAQVLLYLIEKGVVRIDDYYIDGTKMESVANRYTFVWAKNVARYKSGLLEKIAVLVEQIEQANEEEASAPIRDEQGTLLIQDSKKLHQTISKLNEKLAEELGDSDENEDESGQNKKQLKQQEKKRKKLEKQIKELEEKHLKKLQKYEAHERKLDGRSSYSKTDEDATFMRMKDDHMKNGQLKPAYNIQIGTAEQFIINYTLHQSTTDWPVFIPHMDDTAALLEQIGQDMPNRIVADAGYGSEQNYDYIAQNNMENYVKYPGFYAEQKKKNKENFFLSANLYYNEELDFYICPMGQKLTYRYSKKVKSRLGYESKVKVYQAQRCQSCPLRGQCHKSKTNRIINRKPNLEEHKKVAKENLWSLKGIRFRKQRNCDVEPVFGHIKSCRHFKRFLLRSLPKVSTEFGLLAIAHNIKKWWATLQFAKIIQLIPNDPNQPPNSPIMTLNSIKIAFFELFALSYVIKHLNPK